MIHAACECGVAYSVNESDLAKPLACRKCGRELICVSAEPLDAGAGAADFDGRLVILDGPSNVGRQILLGGVPEIELGKLPERHVSLTGEKVSRLHCKLACLDFGPSRWKVVDNKSTNGLFVNRQRVAEKELEDGDELLVGEYRLRYLSDAARPAPLPALPVAQGVAHDGPPCPSCEQPLARGAKICVRCGIYAETGRPLITAHGMDEDALYVRAETWIKFVSWLVPITPLPMPLASEAYGARKPYTIWAIACLTVLISIIFFAAQHGKAAEDTKNLMLWNPKASTTGFSFDSLGADNLKEIVSELKPAERRALAARERALVREGLSGTETRRRALKETYPEEIAAFERTMGEQLGKFHSSGTSFSPMRCCTTRATRSASRCTWGATCCSCSSSARASTR